MQTETHTARAYRLHDEAAALSRRIVRKEHNVPTPQAWAQVARLCMFASSAMRDHIAASGDNAATRLELSFFNNVGRTEWTARAQLETIDRMVDERIAAR